MGSDWALEGSIVTSVEIPGFYFKIESGEAGWYTASVQEGTPQEDAMQGWYEVGSLQLFEDEDGQWVNNIEVKEDWRRYGIGTALIAAAIADHEKIYFSNAPDDPDNDSDDTRHCSTEATALAESCITKHMAVEWETPSWARDPDDHY